jgi:hypothetical protein
VLAAFMLAEIDAELKAPYEDVRVYQPILDIGRGTVSYDRKKYINNKYIYNSKINRTKKNCKIASLPVVLEEEDEDNATDLPRNGVYGTFVENTSNNNSGSTNNKVIESEYKDEEMYSSEESINSNRENEINKNIYGVAISRKKLYCVCLLCFCLYGGILPFFDMSNPIIHMGFLKGPQWKGMKKSERETWISSFQSIPIITLTLGAPCVSVIVDLYGHRTSFFILASSLLVFGHFLILEKLGDDSFLLLALLVIGFAYA